MNYKTFATIVVATRNRLELLQKMLENTKKQNRYPQCEIIVMDDASDVEIKDSLISIFPEVTFVRVPTQAGYVWLRNEAFRKASSEYVFFLDDDSWFEQNDAVERGVNFFREHVNTGILSFEVRLADGSALPKTHKKRPYKTSSFIGVAHAVKKPFFENEDIYDSDYFRQGEERDLALRCLDKGYDIMQVGDITVYHEETPKERNHQFIHGYAFRNELIFYLTRFPAVLAPVFMIKCIVSHTFFCMRRRWFHAYFFGLSEFFKKFRLFYKKRKSVSFKTTIKYLSLRKV